MPVCKGCSYVDIYEGVCFVGQVAEVDINVQVEKEVNLIFSECEHLQNPVEVDGNC